MKISAQTQICMIIGDPVAHSLSPTMHNAGYRALNIDDQYVYVGCRVSSDALQPSLAAIKTLHIRGVSCTAPHKTALVELLDELDPVAKKIGAVNTIVNDNDQLKGYNTDWLGVVRPLEYYGSLKGKKVALIGSGGAARAAAYGLSQKQAEVTIFNRTLAKASLLAKEFGARACSLDTLDSAQSSDILINTVSYDGDYEDNPVKAIADNVLPGQILFDITYGAQTNPLLSKAQERGARVINGLEMLLYQGIAQFELFTGNAAPESAMRAAIGANIRSKP